MAKNNRYTLKERQDIEALLNEGKDFRYISEYIQRSYWGIKREIKRNTTEGRYVALEAQKRADLRKEIQREGTKREISDSQIKMILELSAEGARTGEILQKVGCSYPCLKRFLKEHGTLTKSRDFENIFDRLKILEEKVERLTKKETDCKYEYQGTGEFEGMTMKFDLPVEEWEKGKEINLVWEKKDGVD